MHSARHCSPRFSPGGRIRGGLGSNQRTGNALLILTARPNKITNNFINWSKIFDPVFKGMHKNVIHKHLHGSRKMKTGEYI